MGGEYLTRACSNLIPTMGPGLLERLDVIIGFPSAAPDERPGPMRYKMDWNSFSPVERILGIPGFETDFCPFISYQMVRCNLWMMRFLKKYINTRSTGYFRFHKAFAWLWWSCLTWLSIFIRGRRWPSISEHAEMVKYGGPAKPAKPHSLQGAAHYSRSKVGPTISPRLIWAEHKAPFSVFPKVLAETCLANLFISTLCSCRWRQQGDKLRNARTYSSLETFPGQTRVPLVTLVPPLVLDGFLAYITLLLQKRRSIGE